MGNVSLNMDSINAESLNGKHDFDFVQNLTPYVSNGNIKDYMLSTTSGFTFVGPDVTGMPNDNTWWFLRIEKPEGTHIVAYATSMFYQTEYRIIYKYIDSKWTSWTNIADGGNADTLDGRHALDFPTIVEVPDGTSANTCTGERSGGITMYRCRAADDSSSTLGFTDVPNRQITNQGLLVVYNFNGAGIAGTHVIWAYQIFISPHYGLTWHRYIDNLTVGDWVKDDEYIGENLLDNPDFKINQRGKSKYAETGYSLDRWILDKYQNDTLDVVDNGILLTSAHSESTPGVRQSLPMEKINDRYVTVSVKLGNFTTSERSSNPGYIQFDAADGTATSVNAVIHGVSQGGVFTVTLFIPSNLNIKYVSFATYWLCTMEIEWVKLEIGSNATPFVAPNPAEELLKIQSMNDDGTPKLVSNNTLPTIMNSQMVSNPNLLINPDFKINQRGLSEYTSTGNVSVYTVDRWSLVAIESATLKYNSESGVTFISNNSEGIIWSEMRQYLEKDVCARLRGKTLTLSAMIDGTLYKGTVVNYDDTSDYQPICIKAGAFEIDLRNIPTSERAAYVRIGGNGPFTVTNIEYVKLEVGSIATPFCPPDPATELAKCQRYYQRIKGVNAIFANGFIGGTTTAYLILPIVPMRVKPSLSLNGNVYLWAPNHIGSTAYKSSAITIGTNAINTSTLPIEATISADTNSVGHGCSMQFRDADSYIELSAEL